MRRRGWLVASALALLGCGQPDDPQAALDATVQRLQDALEAKDTDAVLDLLDAKFRAQDDLDREWARKTRKIEGELELVLPVTAHAAFHKATRHLAMSVAGTSKLVFIGLVLSHGTTYLSGQAAVAVVIDSVMVLIFGTYLATKRPGSHISGPWPAP